MQLGKNNSAAQQYLLNRALDGDITDIVDGLHQLTHDEDILDGSEDINSSWAHLFKQQHTHLKRILSREKLQLFEGFFNQLPPLINPVLGKLDISKLDTVFLLGAGASKPSPSGIPTVKELLPQLLERGRRLDREDFTKLADYCEKRRIDNIEDLLTAAHLASYSSRNPTVLGLHEYLLYGIGEPTESERRFDSEHRTRVGVSRIRRTGSVANVASVAFLQDTLQVLFGLLASTMLPAKPNNAHVAIAEFAQQHPSTVIVTTNYDCCMDLALEQAKHPLAYRIQFSNQRIEDEEAQTALIKLHGSLNWYYCDTCQAVQCVDISDTIERYSSDRAPYSVIAICKDCGGQRRGLLVPPLAMKFDMSPPLTPLLTEARAAFEKANAIVVVGFSFAEADLYISRMLAKSMQTSPKQRLVIIDPSSELGARVQRRFKLSIPNFDENRIIHVEDDCSAAVPKLLSGGYRTAVISPDEKSKEPRRRRRPPPSS